MEGGAAQNDESSDGGAESSRNIYLHTENDPKMIKTLKKS